MKIEDMPDAAVPFPDESIFSWLNATRVKLGLASIEWRQWCGFSEREPERRIDGSPWGQLPPELGQIRRIPAAWRIAGEWRQIACAHCSSLDGKEVRYPVLVDWLDARTIACSEHRVLLCSFPAEDPVPVTVTEEIQGLYEWLQQWRQGSIGVQEARLRRDLVLAAGRNWSPEVASIASAELAWAIEGTGWRLPKAQSRYRPRGPSRIGALNPMDRAAALLGAYRAWRALTDRSSESLPHWPTAAWEWLERRLRPGAGPEIGVMLGGIVIASRNWRR